MCGFGGILNSSIYFSHQEVRHIAKLVSHRGPDSTCITLLNDQLEEAEPKAPNCFFFNRLAIIDLDSRSNQPFEDDGFLLVFNGEIYNFRILREELERKGVTFKTSSDTEVLFHAIKIWGKECLSKLNGMFSFFWLNKKDRKFLIARDRTGIKPLYYMTEGGAFLFASELNSIARFSREKPQLSHSAIQNYLCLQYIPTPDTPIEGIKKLPPGHFIESSYKELENGIDCRPVPFWDCYSYLSEAKDGGRKNFELVLKNSIERQLEADVPLGLLLSSGVDSSLLVAVINKYFGGRDFDFFTIAFDRNTAADEAANAASYLAGFNNSHFNHHQLVLSPRLIASKLETLYQYIDEPFGDSATLLNWSISSKAREHVTVVLSGDGADEMFWGYPRYREWENQYYRMYKRAFFLPYFKNMFNALPKSRLKYTLINMCELDPVGIHFNLLRPRLFGFLPDIRHDKSLWCLKGVEKLKNRGDLPALLDLKGYLADAMLYKVDRSSMAASLEVRVPFLDNEVIDYALSLSFEEKSTSEFNSKAPLKKLLSDLAPHYDINRPKKGFSFPLDDWLRTEWKDIVMDNVTNKNLIDVGLEPKLYLNILDNFYKDKVSCTNEVWYLFNLVLWHRTFKNSLINKGG